MQIKLDAGDVGAFRAAIAELAAFGKRAGPVANNFAVATAVLLHRTGSGVRSPHAIARPDEGLDPISTRTLQIDVCDRTWEKESSFLPEAAEGPIFKPFGFNFKGRSPQTNNWRNSFDPQTGLGCNAPFADQYLASPGYLAEPRFDCVFREAMTGHCTAVPGNHPPTCFNPNKRDVPPKPGDTDAPQRPKLLKRVAVEQIGNGFWYLEPTVDVLTQLLSTPTARVPLFPFATALYGGSTLWRSHGDEISEERFASDLALGDERFYALFDPDPESISNARFLTAVRAGQGVAGPVDFTPNDTEMVVELSQPTTYLDRSAESITVRAGKISDPQARADLLERATQGHRRALNCLAADLRARGFDVDEQFDGYDLRAYRDDQFSHLFEVKTWTPGNLAKQVRRGWAQLYEYAYRNHFPSESIALYLVFDREPPQQYWAWEWLADHLGVLPSWVAGEKLTTFVQYAHRLPD